MSDDANDLIERMEHETRLRVDDPNGFAMAGLFGAIARAMEKSSHNPKDDVVVGVVIKNRMTSEYEQDQRDKRILVDLLVAGVSPDAAAALMGRKTSVDVPNTLNPKKNTGPA